MKKILALMLAMVLVFSLAACNGETTPTPDPTAQPTEEPTATSTEEPTAEPTQEPTPVSSWEPEVSEVTEDDKVANYVDQIVGDTEQGPVWYYLSDDGDGIRELNYTPDWGDNWQYSAAPSADDVYYSLFDQDEVYRAWAGTWAGMNIKIIIAWRAYQDGTVDIGAWDYTAYEYNDTEMTNVVEGGVVTVMHNDTELFSETTTTDAANNLFEGTQIEVAEGDIIYFIMDGENATKATFTIDTVSVSYTE